MINSQRKNSDTFELVSTADQLMPVVKNSIIELAEACGGKDRCTDPNCMYHGVQRHKDPRSNPFLDLCYTSTMVLYHLLEEESCVDHEAFNKIVKLRRKDGPTGRRNAKGPVKHFWLDIDGHIFDPSYDQYVIGETALPTYENWDDYKQRKQLSKPERVLPLFRQAKINLISA